ncbi:MAG: hypothetical protein KDI36_12195, partial [Pseudomonadales bacterium]|nr:hypothetical protein [Pseudomonadales bacterium]
NTGFSLIMLACLYSVIPAIFKFVAMPLLWTYPLTEERLQEIQQEITVKHAAENGEAGATPASTT